MMDNFMSKAEELESEEIWALITELRKHAAEYHDLSLRHARREERNIDLSEISKKYHDAVNGINDIISQSEGI